ncbi:hypothetical protein [Cryobacterium sp. 10I5]|uniref:hypothetical protein n=1 Tax=Cryobacterium sp. 10I5 TaxID=3048581 RepID=UPI002B238602|nr:hypothetical protein [Cryobacterium sp. 10I5]MEB0265469.1 hypothetical protein [Cryobacterium sp. 10I5]
MASLARYDELFSVDIADRVGGRVMTGSEAASQTEYYARALRAPRISEVFRRLGDQARDAGFRRALTELGRGRKDLPQ